MTPPTYWTRLAAHLTRETRRRHPGDDEVKWTEDPASDAHYIARVGHWAVAIHHRDTAEVTITPRDGNPGARATVRLEGPEARDVRMILATITDNGGTP